MLEQRSAALGIRGRARVTTEFGAFGTFELGARDDLVWEKNPLEIAVPLAIG